MNMKDVKDIPLLHNNVALSCSLLSVASPNLVFH